MTSSLVGSEMCIRDRTLVPLPLVPPLLVSMLVLVPLESLSLVSKGLPAVSYTHLTLPTICSV
eukprot:2684410-Prorocentrum_lima.AAC.1